VLIMGRYRRRVIQLTLLAVIWGMAMPLLAALLPARAATVWVDVCESPGVRQVALDTLGPGDAGPHQFATDLCTYCRLQQDSPATVPPPALAWRMAVAGAEGCPPYKAGPGRTKVVALSHPSRAPPTAC